MVCRNTFSFFVRAGRPQSLDDALQSAKIGEAVGYRHDSHTSVDQPEVNAIKQPTCKKKDDVLQSQIDALSRKLENLISGTCKQNVNPTVCMTTGATSDKQIKTCYQCSGKGHIKPFCNWAQQREAVPSTECQLCHQFGHAAGDCKKLFPGTSTGQDAGNMMGSGVEERVRPVKSSK